MFSLRDVRFLSIYMKHFVSKKGSLFSRRCSSWMEVQSVFIFNTELLPFIQAGGEKPPQTSVLIAEQLRNHNDLFPAKL